MYSPIAGHLRFVDADGGESILQETHLPPSAPQEATQRVCKITQVSNTSLPAQHTHLSTSLPCYRCTLLHYLCHTYTCLPRHKATSSASLTPFYLLSLPLYRFTLLHCQHLTSYPNTCSFQLPTTWVHITHYILLTSSHYSPVPAAPPPTCCFHFKIT